MLTLLRRSVGVLSFAVAPLGAAAQQPTRTLVATPSEIAGVVRDTVGVPLRDVEIVLPLLEKRARTDSAGRFAVLGVVPGTHEVVFRRIGFTSVTFDWTAEEGKRVEIAVTLRALPNTLDPVVVFANEGRSLSSRSKVIGVVVDSSGAPVPSADVQLIGTSRSTVTAEDGSFEFRHVPPGTVTLRARHMGFRPVALMIELQDDDQREVIIRTERLAQMLDGMNIEASGYGSTDAAWKEFGVREKWRSNAGAIALGPQQLREAGGMPLDWLLRGYQLPPGARAPSQIDANNGGRQRAVPPDPLAATMSCILENGITFRYVPIGTYDARDVQRVEYYPPAPPDYEYSHTIEPRMQELNCKRGSRGERPAYYVLWLKNAR